MATLSSGMLLGDMEDYYNDVLSNYTAAGRPDLGQTRMSSLGIYAPGTTPAGTTPAGTTPTATTPAATTTTGAPFPYEYNPIAVGEDVAQYYGTLLPTLPSYNAIQRNILGYLQPAERYELEQAGAERGVGVGSYGGGGDLTALMRALASGSQERTDTGIEQYRQLFGTVPGIDTSSLYISPFQQEEMNLNWRTTQARIAAEQQLQRERIAAEQAMQSERLREAAALQANQLSSSNYRWGVERSDTWAAVNDMNRRLDQMVNRTAATGTTAGGASTPGVNSWVSGTGGEAGWWGTPWDTSTPWAAPSAGASGGGESSADYWNTPISDEQAWEEGFI